CQQHGNWPELTF
nr:immunoglobulin light chain junction region [Macaca mulatta]